MRSMSTKWCYMQVLELFSCFLHMFFLFLFVEHFLFSVVHPPSGAWCTDPEGSEAWQVSLRAQRRFLRGEKVFKQRCFKERPSNRRFGFYPFLHVFYGFYHSFYPFFHVFRGFYHSFYPFFSCFLPVFTIDSPNYRVWQVLWKTRP